MLRFYVLMAILTFTAHGQEPVPCEISESHKEQALTNLKVNCGGPNFFMSPQSLMKESVIELEVYAIPIGSSEDSHLRLDPIEVQLDDTVCKSYECFKSQDILLLLSESYPREYKKIEDALSKLKVAVKLKLENTTLKSAILDPRTPAFGTPPGEVFYSEEDIYFSNNLLGILDANMETVSLDFNLSPQEQYDAERNKLEIVLQEPLLSPPATCGFELVLFSSDYMLDVYYDNADELAVIILENHKQYQDIAVGLELNVVELSYCLSKKVHNISKHLSKELEEELEDTYGSIDCSEFRIE